MTAPSLEERFFVDAMSPEFRDDPYPHYEAYRARSPFLQVADTVWLSFAHAEVTALLRDPRLSSDESRATTEIGQDTAKSRSMLFMDPPDHTRLRRLVARAFTPTRVEGLRHSTQAATNVLLDDVSDAASGGATVDLVTMLAYPLPVRVICSLLGVPRSDEAMFTSWSRALARSLDPSILRSPNDEIAIAEAESGLSAYLADLLDRRRTTPGDDLLSALAAVEADGDRITPQEAVELAILLLVAGHETTVNLIGNGLLALFEHPDQCNRLRTSPELVAPAVDELLRYDAPVQLTQRIVTHDIELVGHRLRAGDEIVLVLGAANHDGAVFDDPDTLDVTRDARRHVGFGGGIHHCLGATLARLEAHVAIASLLDRFPHAELAGSARRRPTMTLRGLETLPVSLT